VNDDWMDELRGVDGTLLPTVAARAEVIEGVRRRRRRRAIGMGVGATGTVAALVAAVLLLPAMVLPDDESPRPAPAALVTTPAASPTPDDAPTPWRLNGGFWEEPAPGDCPEVSRVFDASAVPPIPDLARQQQVVTELAATDFRAFGVRHAAPTALGVVALVTGDVAVAERVLREDYGVELVHEWDRSGPDVGLDVDGQVGQVIAWQIEPVGHRLDREVRGLDGYAEIAMWQSAGGVLLSWKAPVPAEIAALAGVRPNGVRVFVEGVPYSEQELSAARQRVQAAVDRGRVDAKISSSTFCGDQSGLVFGIPPRFLGDGKEELEQELAGIAGMPVTVVPGSPPVDLLQGTIDR